MFFFTLIYAVTRPHLRQFGVKIRLCDEELILGWLTVGSQTLDSPEDVRATQTDKYKGKNLEKWGSELKGVRVFPCSHSADTHSVVALFL